MTRRKNAIDENGDPLETAIFHKTDAERLLRFNITGQRIADRCNEARILFPWDQEVNRSTWNRALNGQPVWESIVSELEWLYDDQTTDPRKYLPGPPTDELFDWMKQIAGATWWVETLGLDMKANTLTAWMSRGGAKQEALDDLRERVSQWWGKVDAACTQADMVRAYHAMEMIEYDRHRAEIHFIDVPRPDSFESYFYTYIQEDGHTVDEARAHYVEMADLGKNYRLRLLDLSDPGPTAVEGYRSPHDTPEAFAQRFDELFSRGFDKALPRDMPEGTDLSDTVREGQWKDRRYEESPWDHNHGLYKKWYRERVSWAWDRDERKVVRTGSEIVAVSDDGETWVEPTERQRKGWDRGNLAWHKWLEERKEMPENQYTRELTEAKDKMLLARAKARAAQDVDSPLWDEFERAREEYERARADY